MVDDAEKGDSGTSSQLESGPETLSTQRKKPLQFYLAFLSLVIMALLVSLDSTVLSVAIPVRCPSHSSSSHHNPSIG